MPCLLLWSLLWRDIIRLLVEAAKLGINLFKSTLEIKKCDVFHIYFINAGWHSKEQWSRKMEEVEEADEYQDLET